MNLVVYLSLGFAALCYYAIATIYLPFRRNLKRAQNSGIHYIIVPFFYLKRFWLVTHFLWLKILARLPEKYTQWVDFVIPAFTFDYGHDIFRRVGHDTFITVSPTRLALFTCEPSVISQITTRRNDFPKPTRLYRVLDIYGKNVISTESATWRQHRKATSPPFTELNNHLVWAESIDQASAMLASWTNPDSKGDKTIHRLMDDTMRLSLHVISRAGFGRKMEWPTTETKERTDPHYFDPSKIQNEETGIDSGHTMSYTYAIHCLIDNIIFQFIVPRWALSKIPFKNFRKANEAYNEFGNYMREAVEAKKQDFSTDQKANNEMDILGQLVQGQILSKDIKGSNQLTDSEILGNIFVLLIAGHETTANSIHFSTIYLALHPQSQRWLQKDIESIFQGRPPPEWNYDRDLPALFGGACGAVLAEELRLLPPVPSIPKSTFGVSDQLLTIENRECIIPSETYVVLAAAAAHRNPNSWPHKKPRLPGGKTVHPISNLENDLEEFRPERWLIAEEAVSEMYTDNRGEKEMPSESLTSDGLAINESSDTSDRLYHPKRGAYLPFSDGYRACLGRRFAQVEVLATLAVIFQNFSVELAVDKYVSDEELISMDDDAKAEVWQKAAQDARDLFLNGMGVVLSLQMRNGHVPVRLVPRGKEKFRDDVDEIWKKNHPEKCTGTRGIPGWKAWKRV